MKIRFFRVVWVFSALLLALTVYGCIFGDTLAVLVLLGWIPLVGFVAVYIFMGSFGWPTQKSKYQMQLVNVADASNHPAIKEDHAGRVRR